MSKKALFSHFPHIIPYMFFDVLGVWMILFDNTATNAILLALFLMVDVAGLYPNYFNISALALSQGKN